MQLTRCIISTVQRKETSYTSMANHFHKSEISHSWLKMYQCAPTLHLFHDENLQQLKKSTHIISNDKEQYDKNKNKKLVTLSSM